MRFAVLHKPGVVGKSMSLGIQGPGLGSGSDICYLYFLEQTTQSSAFILSYFLNIKTKDMR